MNGYIAFNLEERRGVNQVLGLWVNGVCGVGIRDGGDGLDLLLLLPFNLLVVKLYVALDDGHGRPIIRRPLLELLLQLCVLLLVRGVDDTPAASPRNASAKANENPLLRLEPGSLHDDIDVVECLSLTGNQSTRVGLLKTVVFINCQADGRRPFDERLMGVEVQEVAITSGGRYAEDVLQGLLVT